MGRQRREFTPEYKDEAVKLVINTGRAVATVARELGVKEQTLGRWVNVYRARQEAGDGALSETERVELARLRREVSELKMDRAFLKKRRSSSPPMPRIRTRSVRTDAGGEEHLQRVADGPAARGVPLGVLRLVQTRAVEEGGAGRADRAEDRLVDVGRLH